MRFLVKAVPFAVMALKTKQGRAVAATGVNGIASVADRLTGRRHTANIEKARAAAQQLLRGPQQGGSASRR